ncbi:MAG: sigma-54-dependent Fis family transcriptional regulator [Blastocatellia bacterium]|jgi:two-component system nitrogen regulation response regulator NtrX|nr:sigma-54-dependent Fis family transcriptional regulator [Blastocatellia bacterium]MBK6428728.1 sigma-54-dependent Fis family transcriptional regulator [Blastocatellia bacterium]
MSTSVLIVDDERGIRESLTGLLEDEGFGVEAVATGEACLSVFEQRPFSCVLLDVCLGDGIDGLEVLGRLKETWPQTPVLMISGHGTIETAVRATKLGALDFIEKPLAAERTIIAVRNAIRHGELELANERMREEIAGGDEMVGISAPVRALRKQIAFAAPTNGRVLVYGESGTGKELVARLIHRSSRRATGPFIEVNCAAIPEELIESELFGHVRGAFTGASAPKSGKFGQADGGTLFLDEIGDMSPRMQSKVLRALEEQRFEPVGGQQAISVDVRVVAATNKRLVDEIEAGRFREDLFYRLNVIPFELPPLRERVEDIPLLVAHFNHRFSEEYARPPKQFSDEATERLVEYRWPGNVRELRNTVERVIIMHRRADVGRDDLPPLNAEPDTSGSPSLLAFSNLRDGKEAFEREYIVRKLEEFDGNVTRTAREMGIDRSHLYRRMKVLGISGR